MSIVYSLIVFFVAISGIPILHLFSMLILVNQHLKLRYQDRFILSWCLFLGLSVYTPLIGFITLATSDGLFGG